MIYFTGFLVGLMGSLHCLGMCGPIALALPVPFHLNRTLAILVYNIGRVLTYAFIGLMFGSIGQVFVLAGFQQYLSIACGFAILIMVLFSAWRPKSGFLTYLSTLLRSHFGNFMRQKTLSSFFMMGALNGLLPCGLVYMALAGATATGGTWEGALYMVVFGVGTAPAMMAIGYAHHLVTIPFRLKIRKIVNVFLLFTGLLLVLRGLNLGIPYISPELSPTSSCCIRSCH